MVSGCKRDTIYCPVAAWVTSYGRNETIRTAQAIREWSEKNLGYDAYVYSDTDSQKVLLNRQQLQQIQDEGIIKVDDYKLGYWALEEEFDRILAIRQKCYITESEGRIHPTISGLPKYLCPIINFENFKRGFTTCGLTVDDLRRMAKENGATDGEIEAIHHKTTYRHCNGGVILVDTDFTIIQVVENF